MSLFYVFFVTLDCLPPLSQQDSTRGTSTRSGDLRFLGALGLLHIFAMKRLKGNRYMSSKPFSEIPPQLKEEIKDKEDLKDKDKERGKEVKDKHDKTEKHEKEKSEKDAKDKDQKDTKDNKEAKEQKEHKEHKEQKDQKEKHEKEIRDKLHTKEKHEKEPKEALKEKEIAKDIETQTTAAKTADKQFEKIQKDKDVDKIQKDTEVAQFAAQAKIVDKHFEKVHKDFDKVQKDTPDKFAEIAMNPGLAPDPQMAMQAASATLKITDKILEKAIFLEKIYHKDKDFKVEKLEKFEKHEKIEFKEFEIPGTVGPGDPVEQRLAAMEATLANLVHFIPAELRPDLSSGALAQEADKKKAAPDAGSSTGTPKPEPPSDKSKK